MCGPLASPKRRFGVVQAPPDVLTGAWRYADHQPGGKPEPSRCSRSQPDGAKAGEVRTTPNPYGTRGARQVGPGPASHRRGFPFAVRHQPHPTHPDPTERTSLRELQKLQIEAVEMNFP